MRATHAVAALVLVAAAATPAQAQPDADRIRIGVNAGVQTIGQTLSEEFTTIMYVETQTTDLTLGLRRSPVLDGGVTVRVKGPIGVSVAVSSTRQKSDGTLTSAIPHPFLFDRFRTVGGPVSSAVHNELAVHLDGAYALRPGRRVELALLGGATVFRVQQDLISSVFFSDTYPYDTVADWGADSASFTKTRVGFNGGVDVTLKLTRAIGVGALIRYSHAVVAFDAGNGAVPSVNAGGLHTLGGIRLGF